MNENTDFTLERQFPRVPFRETPWVFALRLTEETLAADPLQLEAQNISLGGLRFLSNKKIPVFTLVTCQLLDKEGKLPPLTLEGKVIRVDETDRGLQEKTYGMALEFPTLLPEVFQAMQDILSQIQK